MINFANAAIAVDTPRKHQNGPRKDASVGVCGKHDDSPEIFFVDHPEFHTLGIHEKLFGEHSEKIEIIPWNHASFERYEDPKSPAPKTRVHTRHEEKILFMRYNYSRYRLHRIQANNTLHIRPKAAAIWRRRAEEYRESIVSSNMPLVLAMYQRIGSQNVPHHEMISEGYLALLRCVDRFDVSKGFKLSTYACRAILKSFHRFVNRHATYVKHFPVLFDPQLERCDYSACVHQSRWEDSIEWVREMLAKNHAKLTPVEQTVLFERFAMGRGGKGMTFEQIGPIIGLSPERTRQILRATLHKVKAAFDRASLSPRVLAKQL